MNTVKLKIVEEGSKHPLEQLKRSIAQALEEEGTSISDQAEVELKIKFTVENDQEVVLLQVRNSIDKHKWAEKIIPYLESKWQEDILSESKSLLLSQIPV